MKSTEVTSPIISDTNVTSSPSKEHEFLKKYRLMSAVVGVSHTFLCAGIVFGWASLLPILRSSSSPSSLQNLSTTTYAQIFTAGAIGNYISNLPFGVLLDNRGPKICGVVASLLFMFALWLCSMGTSQFYQTNFTKNGNGDGGLMLGIGYFALGFAGPAIQIPTLHLAKLFQRPQQIIKNKSNSKNNNDSGGGGDAAYMSAQAAAFDGGTAIFALFAYSAQLFEWQASPFFLLYSIIPMYTFLTAVYFWPHQILPDDDESSEGNTVRESQSTHSFGGPGSPFLSPHSAKQMSLRNNKKRQSEIPQVSPLKDAPLSKVLTHSSFYCLAIWVALHILKLNFVVATINDQLLSSFHVSSSSTPLSLNDESDSPLLSSASSILSLDAKIVPTLINIFGAMLPFGFVIMPLTAYLLQTNPLSSFQMANIFGIVYGGILTWAPRNTFLLSCVAFPMVATSRQLVYSTVFHQIGALFGFMNFGVLLGLTNVVVSLVSLIQNPFVSWAEKTALPSNTFANYFGPNLTLLLMTVPLFGVVYLCIIRETVTHDEKGSETNDGGLSRKKKGYYSINDESKTILQPRRNSYGGCFQETNPRSMV